MDSKFLARARGPAPSRSLSGCDPSAPLILQYVMIPEQVDSLDLVDAIVLIE